jgi:hypothetical protein
MYSNCSYTRLLTDNILHLSVGRSLVHVSSSAICTNIWMLSEINSIGAGQKA